MAGVERQASLPGLVHVEDPGITEELGCVPWRAAAAGDVVHGAQCSRLLSGAGQQPLHRHRGDAQLQGFCQPVVAVDHKGLARRRVFPDQQRAFHAGVPAVQPFEAVPLLHTLVVGVELVLEPLRVGHQIACSSQLDAGLQAIGHDRGATIRQGGQGFYRVLTGQLLERSAGAGIGLTKQARVHLRVEHTQQLVVAEIGPLVTAGQKLVFGQLVGGCHHVRGRQLRPRGHRLPVGQGLLDSWQHRARGLRDLLHHGRIQPLQGQSNVVDLGQLRVVHRLRHVVGRSGGLRCGGLRRCHGGRGRSCCRGLGGGSGGRRGPWRGWWRRRCRFTRGAPVQIRLAGPRVHCRVGLRQITRLGLAKSGEVAALNRGDRSRLCRRGRRSSWCRLAGGVVRHATFGSQLLRGNAQHRCVLLQHGPDRLGRRGSHGGRRGWWRRWGRRGLREVVASGGRVRFLQTIGHRFLASLAQLLRCPVLPQRPGNMRQSLKQSRCAAQGASEHHGCRDLPQASGDPVVSRRVSGQCIRHRHANRLQQAAGPAHRVVGDEVGRGLVGRSVRPPSRHLGRSTGTLDRSANLQRSHWSQGSVGGNASWDGLVDIPIRWRHLLRQPGAQGLGGGPACREDRPAWQRCLGIP